MAQGRALSYLQGPMLLHGVLRTFGIERRDVDRVVRQLGRRWQQRVRAAEPSAVWEAARLAVVCQRYFTVCRST